MEQPLVSVIIPVYNAEKYLGRCLDSVAAQLYSNIEIVVVNDGSTDGSPYILRQYARQDMRLKVYETANQGASLARKMGLKESHGKYVLFVDSDDYVTPDYVSSLYGAMCQYDTKAAVCSYKRLLPDEELEENSKIDQYECLPQKQVLDRFFKYEFWGFWGGCYDRLIFNEIQFPQATVNEDYFVKAQIFSKLDKVAYVPTAKYVYEQHPGSLSKQSLSLRALGEFDNALLTWHFVKLHIPKYNKNALSIVSEVCCKWLQQLNVTVNEMDCVSAEFLSYHKRMRKFVQSNFIAIIFNPYLMWTLKIVLMRSLVRSYL